MRTGEGVYPINAVDCVTHGRLATCEWLSEAY